MKSPTCSIFFHNYYGHHENWIRFFSEKMNIPFTLFYNVVEDSFYNQEEDHLLAKRLLKAATSPFLKKIVLRRSPNQGKDIGGKLVLLDACLLENEVSDYHIFLHDKKSPYKIQGKEWQEKLFRIIEPDYIEKVLTCFRKDRQVALIAGSDSIGQEYDEVRQSFVSNNHDKLMKLRSEFDITGKDYRYVVGTMFWARAAPLLSFFNKYPPLEIRKTLEKGNIMDQTAGTMTHAWERMLSWLIFAQGYTLKGV